MKMKKLQPSEVDSTLYLLLFEIGDEFDDVERVVVQDLASPESAAGWYRHLVEERDLGSSQVSFGKVVRKADHKLIATISYNGRVQYEQ